MPGHKDTVSLVYHAREERFGKQFGHFQPRYSFLLGQSKCFGHTFDRGSYVKIYNQLGDVGLPRFLTEVENPLTEIFQQRLGYLFGFAFACQENEQTSGCGAIRATDDRCGQVSDPFLCVLFSQVSCCLRRNLTHLDMDSTASET